MRRHERALGGAPSRGLTKRLRTVKGLVMEPEPGDLTVIEAAQRIIALHNEDPGEPGGYILYDPFTPKRFEARRRVSESPRVGYVAITAGENLPRDSGYLDYLIFKIQQARRERADPDSGSIFV